jgi:uncharacterized protein (DUF488 family)
MLYDRQRLLLTLLEVLGEPVGHTDFQKLLFLYTQEHEDQPSYEFVPYRFGGFSFTSYADKRRLVERGFLEDDEQTWRLTSSGRKTVSQEAVDPLQIAAFCRKYATLRGNELVSEVYRRQPYFAIRSEILHKIPLEKQTIAAIESARPKRQEPGLLTIGYEGKSLESYLNQLIRADVTVLCDVRRNPLSRKYGFSKTTLAKACDGLGIRYVHFPELGIPSEARRNLNTQEQYDRLFADYEREVLPLQAGALNGIRSWVSKGERAALTCFERFPHQCHRHCVANELKRVEGEKLTLVHL